MGAVILCVLLWGVNYFTGIFTAFHLRNEEEIAMQHGVNTPLYEEMVDELIGDTRSHEVWERKIAAAELGHLGRGAARATQALEKLLDDDSQVVRAEAAIALARIGSHTEKTVSALIELLQGGSDHRKYLAAKALGMVGAGAQAAVPALGHELQEGHADVRQAARLSLEKIGTPEARQVLEQTSQP